MICCTCIVYKYKKGRQDNGNENWPNRPNRGNENRQPGVEIRQPAVIEEPRKQTVLRAIGFNKNIKFAGDPLCTIDLSGFRKGWPVILTPCSHIFHLACIEEWLNASGRERKCPNCNFTLGQYTIQKN